MTHGVRVAALFHDRPHTWIDGREIAAVGGAYAWRTRLSEYRWTPQRVG